jgi:hypothetical protein
VCKFFNSSLFDRVALFGLSPECVPKPRVVRQLVAEAAWQALRRSPTFRAYFERTQRGDPQRKKIALVATAHYLVRVLDEDLDEDQDLDEDWGSNLGFGFLVDRIPTPR